MFRKTTRRILLFQVQLRPRQFRIKVIVEYIASVISACKISLCYNAKLSFCPFLNYSLVCACRKCRQPRNFFLWLSFFLYMAFESRRVLLSRDVVALRISLSLIHTGDHDTVRSHRVHRRSKSLYT